MNSAKIHERFIIAADQFVTALAVKECHLPRVPAGSLLIAITGQGKTLGNSALVRFETCIYQHLAYGQFTADKVLPEFVLWFMQTRYDHLRSISSGGGSTKGALTCGYLKTYPSRFQHSMSNAKSPKHLPPWIEKKKSTSANTPRSPPSSARCCTG